MSRDMSRAARILHVIFIMQDNTLAGTSHSPHQVIRCAYRCAPHPEPDAAGRRGAEPVAVGGDGGASDPSC